MKTMIQWHVTKFWKSAIFWVVMALSDNFTVRASKCRSDGKHHTQHENSNLRERNDSVKSAYS